MIDKYFAKGIIDRWKYKRQLSKLKFMEDNKPLSKEEILKKHKSGLLYIDKFDIDGDVDDVYDAMDEFARQEAINFWKFCVKNKYQLTLAADKIYDLYNKEKGESA